MGSDDARPRRRQTLSRAGIIELAIELLDSGGEAALTVRALTERLSTGAGAIYYRVGGRDDVLDAATETVVLKVLRDPVERDSDSLGGPQTHIQTLALRLFDAIDAHPWLASCLIAQLVRRPGGPVAIGLFEGLGAHIRDMGVPQAAWFVATSTVVHYLLGAISQTARDGSADGHDRERFLDDAAATWGSLNVEAYPVVQAMAEQMHAHDDRAQFVTGITLVLAGISHASGAAGGEPSADERNPNV